MANHVLARIGHSRPTLLSANRVVYSLRLLANQRRDEDEDELFLKKDEEFRKLDLLPVKSPPRTERKTHFGQIKYPRYTQMPPDQDWTNVWPTARVFHPGTVPLPLYMGYTPPDSKEVPAGKFANPELLKIPNFLHLTPPAIKKQCEALKKFCTNWPKGLETDEKCDKHFPIEIKTQEFVFSAQSLRWPDYRIVELSLKMSDLPLNYHARDKMKRILMERYDPKTDTITIKASRCPTRKQNYDYAYYLLTAVFFESWKVEEWETEKSEADWERYYWEKSKSKESVVSYLKQVKPDVEEEEIVSDEAVQSYARSVTKLYDEKGNKDNVEEYKQNVLRLLF